MKELKGESRKAALIKKKRSQFMVKPSSLLIQAVQTAMQIYKISDHVMLRFIYTSINLEYLRCPDFYLKTYMTLFTLVLLP